MAVPHPPSDRRRQVPEAFDETRWTLLTEFGRFVHAKCGQLLSTYLLWTPTNGLLTYYELLTNERSACPVGAG
jgi:hypothetical protein